MLYLTFKEPTDKDKFILAPGDIFDYMSEDDWFEDDIIKDVIRKIDQSTVISEGAVDSDILGIVPMNKISGGAKTLILFLKWKEAHNYIFRSASLGDNCFPYVYEWSKKLDITLYVTSYFVYPEIDDLQVVCVDNGKIYSGKHDIMAMIIAGNAGVLK